MLHREACGEYHDGNWAFCCLEYGRGFLMTLYSMGHEHLVMLESDAGATLVKGSSFSHNLPIT